MFSIVSLALQTLGVWNLSQHCNLIQNPKQFRFQVTCYPLLEKHHLWFEKNTIFNNFSSVSWQVSSFTSYWFSPVRIQLEESRSVLCHAPITPICEVPSSRAVKKTGVGRQIGGGTVCGSQGNILNSGLPRNKIMHHLQQWTIEENESKLNFW